MNNKFSKEEVKAFISRVIGEKETNFALDYLYEIYDASFDAIEDLFKDQKVTSNTPIDSLKIISYILGEYIYSTELSNEEAKKKFMEDEKIMQSMASVASDKYLSLSLYRHREDSLTSEYIPPISSIQLYINLMLNILNVKYGHNKPQDTLVIDLLVKSLSIGQSIINLLCDGYETGAFAMWRTLHECECTLILLEKYGELAINNYLKHMKYGLAYKNALGSKEETDKVFEQIKAEMSKHELKSKDMKKYIEYGWLYPIQEKANVSDFKLNFRDGLELLAGLHGYSELYMTSSEILHSTPLLIYSNKKYFYYITLLNLYESFFRIEKVFSELFLSTVSDLEKKRYIDMRNLYYSQLVNIHKRETMKFSNFNKKVK